MDSVAISVKLFNAFVSFSHELQQGESRRLVTLENLLEANQLALLDCLARGDITKEQFDVRKERVTGYYAALITKEKERGQ